MISSRHKSLLAGVLFASLSAIAYSTNTPLSPIVFAGGGSALLIIVMRSIGAVVLSAVILPLQQQPANLTSDLRPTLTLSLFLFAQGAFYVASVAFIPVSLAALVFFTWPVWVGLVDVIASARRNSISSLGYFGVALIGLIIALQADFSTLDIRGILLALGGALSMSVYVLLASRILPRTASPLTLNLQINVGIVAIGLLILMPFETMALPGDRVTLIALAAIAGFYTIATLTQIIAIRTAGAPVAALFYNLEPIASICLAVIILEESFGTQQIIGGSMVIGVLIVYSYRRFSIRSTD